jgi:bifunctional non-homologous end joining protein LigD
VCVGIERVSGRLMRRADALDALDVLVALERLVFPTDGCSRRGLRRLLRSPTAEVFWVGNSAAAIVLFRRGSDIARLYSLAVAPGARRQGWGWQFLQYAEGVARARECRRKPLEARKATLASLLAKAALGLRLNDHIEEEDGETVFRHACKLGLEGIVSKLRNSPYRSGRSPDWLKMKNPACEAVRREEEEDWGR